MYAGGTALTLWVSRGLLALREEEAMNIDTSADDAVSWEMAVDGLAFVSVDTTEMAHKTINIFNAGSVSYYGATNYYERPIGPGRDGRRRRNHKLKRRAELAELRKQLAELEKGQGEGKGAGEEGAKEKEGKEEDEWEEGREEEGEEEGEENEGVEESKRRERAARFGAPQHQGDDTALLARGWGPLRKPLQEDDDSWRYQ
ncbi:hypothetical protein B0A49_09456 [Cryomyces minteri]|nr:hypothetical protein B0A49_09456 [Cryomyces minteri]